MGLGGPDWRPSTCSSQTLVGVSLPHDPLPAGQSSARLHANMWRQGPPPPILSGVSATTCSGHGTTRHEKLATNPRTSVFQWIHRNAMSAASCVLPCWPSWRIQGSCVSWSPSRSIYPLISGHDAGKPIRNCSRGPRQNRKESPARYLTAVTRSRQYDPWLAVEGPAKTERSRPLVT